MRIRYVAPALSPDGYGEFSRYVIWALQGHDVSLTLLHHQAEPEARFGPKGLLAKELVDRPIGMPDVNIVNATPYSFEQFRLPSCLNVGFTMFESEKIDQPSVFACNRMDAILVPSSWNKATYRKCGVIAPIHVVHPCMVAPPDPRPSPGGPFTFLSVFEWRTPHKDPASLLEAYFHAFAPEDPVLLRIKTFERTRPGYIEGEVKKAKRGRKTPPVELILGSLSSSEMWEHYQDADCYVSSHHGEGWGMPIFEAMAAGRPAIATAFAANLEFMTRENSSLVKYTYDPKKAWADVDIPDLSKKMRDAYDHPKSGHRARKDVLKFTPERTEAMVMKAIRAVEKAA